VLQLTTDLGFGGAERVIVDLVRSLIDVGVECAVAGLTADEPEMARRLEDAGIEVFSAGMSPGRRLRPLARLRRFVRRWEPDVLHCHLFHAHLASVLLRCSGVTCPVVWTHHTVERRPLPLRRAFYRLLSGWPECKVYAFGAVRRYQRSVSGVAPWEELIHNGIELGPFLAVKPRPGPVFGAVGRLVPKKGYDVLLRAFARLSRRNADARLVIAGRGPMQDELQELIRSEGLSDCVELAGFVRDVPAFLGRVNVFVHPSRGEGFGVALLEAMAAGLPCIASRVDALPEIGGNLVRWVRPGDVEGLHRSMQDVCRVGYPTERIVGQRLRAEDFSCRTMAEDYLEVYRSLLGE
jgi:glycosyltransferase involved in cell wall biosynthesis